MSEQNELTLTVYVMKDGKRTQKTMKALCVDIQTEKTTFFIDHKDGGLNVGTADGSISVRPGDDETVDLEA